MRKETKNGATVFGPFWRCARIRMKPPDSPPVPRGDSISNMDLNLTPQEFRDEVRAWLHANVPGDWERRRTEDDMRERFAFLRGWQRRVYEAGWAGIAWPKEYGGRGA